MKKLEFIILTEDAALLGSDDRTNFPITLMDVRFVFGVMLWIRQHIEGRQREIGKNTDPNLTGDRNWVSITFLEWIGSGRSPANPPDEGGFEMEVCPHWLENRYTTGRLILGCSEKHFAVPSTRSDPNNRQGYPRIACELRRDRSDVIYTLTLYILWCCIVRRVKAIELRKIHDRDP